jgi:hypothetical protein
VQLSQTSNFGPSLAMINDQPSIGYTATDGSLRLITALLGPQDQIFEINVTVGPPGKQVPQFSNHRPSLLGEGQAYFIAWTGTDPDHKLNIAANDGLAGSNFSNQLIFDETSIAAPCLANCIDANFGGHIILCWVGTDPQKSLNAMISDGLTGWGDKATYNQTSIDTPALFAIPEDTNYIAWTGTDAVGTLTFGRLPIYPDQVNPLQDSLQVMHVYSNDQDGGPDFSESGPALAYTPLGVGGGATILAYRGTSENRLYTFGTGENTEPPLPQYTENVNSLQRQVLNVSSLSSPAIAFDSTGNLWWAWLDDGGHLNFAADADLPRQLAPG